MFPAGLSYLAKFPRIAKKQSPEFWSQSTSLSNAASFPCATRLTSRANGSLLTISWPLGLARSVAKACAIAKPPEHPFAPQSIPTLPSRQSNKTDPNLAFPLSYPFALPRPRHLSHAFFSACPNSIQARLNPSTFCEIRFLILVYVGRQGRLSASLKECLESGLLAATGSVLLGRILRHNPRHPSWFAFVIGSIFRRNAVFFCRPFS